MSSSIGEKTVSDSQISVVSLELEEVEQIVAPGPITTPGYHGNHNETLALLPGAEQEGSRRLAI
jgi:hypothetical protein